MCYESECFVDLWAFCVLWVDIPCGHDEHVEGDAECGSGDDAEVVAGVGQQDQDGVQADRVGEAGDLPEVGVDCQGDQLTGDH